MHVEIQIVALSNYEISLDTHVRAVSNDEGIIIDPSNARMCANLKIYKTLKTTIPSTKYFKVQNSTMYFMT